MQHILCPVFVKEYLKEGKSKDDYDPDMIVPVHHILNGQQIGACSLCSVSEGAVVEWLEDRLRPVLHEEMRHALATGEELVPCGLEYESWHGGTRRCDLRRFGHSKHTCLLRWPGGPDHQTAHKCVCGLTW